MPIKSYTTDRSPRQTVESLQNLLARKGARAVMIEYDDEGEPLAVAFRVIVTAHGEERPISFRLAAKPEGALAALQRTPKLKSTQRTLQHAKRVAWRLVYNWIDVTLAFVEAEQATLAQALLGMSMTPTGVTFYEMLITGEEGKRLLTEKLEA